MKNLFSDHTPIFSRRKFLNLSIGAALAMSVLPAANVFAAQSAAKKPLVVYYSISGNTRKLADMIHNKVGGDIVEIKTAKPYPSDYNQLTDVAKHEQINDARPAITTRIPNMDDYGIIYLGSPNWWGSLAMPVWTFVSMDNVNGKTIAPFITHGSGGVQNCITDLKRLAPKSRVLTPLVVNGSRVGGAQGEVDNWLKKISGEAGA